MIQPFDLLGALLGAIFVAVGAGAALLSRLGAGRAGSALGAFGVFSLLYGVRLLVRSEAVGQAVGLAGGVSVALAAAMTYWILVPLGLLAALLLGPGRWGSLHRVWQVTAVYATGAVLWDMATATPAGAIGLNPWAVFANMAVVLPQAVAAYWRVRWTREGRLLVAASLLFATVAAYETAFGGMFGRIELEPVTMLVLVTALGAFVAAQLFASERRLAAVTYELALASRIQQSILPRTVPSLPGLRAAARYLPTGAVAGDLYDFVEAPGQGLGVLVADVSGHGVPAAIIASMVKVTLAAERAHAADPPRVLAGMNRALCGKFEQAYVTAVFASIDAGGRRVQCASAGHPPPLLRRADGRLEPLDCSGLVLGFDPGASYTAATAALAPGDRLLLWTDGLLDAERQDVLFGEGELQRWLQRAPDGTIDALADALVQAARRWASCEDRPLPDDVTLVIVEAI